MSVSAPAPALVPVPYQAPVPVPVPVPVPGAGAGAGAGTGAEVKNKNMQSPIAKVSRVANTIMVAAIERLEQLDLVSPLTSFFFEGKSGSTRKTCDLDFFFSIKKWVTM